MSEASTSIDQASDPVSATSIKRNNNNDNKHEYHSSFIILYDIFNGHKGPKAIEFIEMEWLNALEQPKLKA